MNLRLLAPALCAILVFGSDANACQCLGDAEYAFKSADHVIVAKVTAAKLESIQFEIEFETLEVLKGGDPAKPLFMIGDASLLCGKSHVSVGRQYVFFIDDVQTQERGPVSSATCHSFLDEGTATEGKLQALRSIGIPVPETRVVSTRCRNYSQLQSQLRQVRLQYTDEHPDVIRTQKLIESVNSIYAAENTGKSLEEMCTANR